ncbi:MAG TPA: hypothetical protein VHQ65_09135, partial [Thermoanaerobaculia bacterium]|nr:hypothetical protein [Thermoanaerobaculia bacterium]
MTDCRQTGHGSCPSDARRGPSACFFGLIALLTLLAACAPALATCALLAHLHSRSPPAPPAFAIVSSEGAVTTERLLAG